MIVRVHESAETDLYSAAARLEARKSGVGFRLIREYNTALELIECQPHLNSLVDDPIPNREIRNAPILRASYRIIYEVRPVECAILAVVDYRLRSGNWHDRIHGV